MDGPIRVRLRREDKVPWRQFLGKPAVGLTGSTSKER